MFTIPLDFNSQYFVLLAPLLMFFVLLFSAPCTEWRAQGTQGHPEDAAFLSLSLIQSLSVILCLMQEIIFQDLGKMDYQSAWDLQEKLLQENVKAKSLAGNLQTTLANDSTDGSHPVTHHHLLFVEHPPVYTLGKSGHAENILISEEERLEKSIEFYPTNRGGDITFHGPGQIVAYPILDLEKFYTDIGRYLRNLEEVVIDLISTYGLKGERSAGETGVWLDPSVKGMERKICAMGVRCSRWITMHGLALNVNTDLRYFDHIVPCGIHDKKVTSLEKELGHSLDMDDLKKRMKFSFEKVFDVKIADIQLVG